MCVSDVFLFLSRLLLFLTGREREDEDHDKGDEGQAVLGGPAQRSNLPRLEDGPLSRAGSDHPGSRYKKGIGGFVLCFRVDHLDTALGTLERGGRNLGGGQYINLSEGDTSR